MASLTNRWTARARWLLLCGVIVGLAAGCGGDSDESSASASTTTSTIAVDQLDDSAFAILLDLKADLSADPVTVALTEFAAYFGNVPGAMTLPHDGSLPGTGTHALEAVSQVGDLLDDSQRAAVKASLAPYVGRAFDEQTADASGPVILAASTELRAFGAPEAATADESEVRSIASWAESEIEGRLGGSPITYTVRVVSEDPEEGEGTTTPIVTLHPGTDWVYDLLGIERDPDVACDIVVGPSFTGRDEAAIRSGIAHELFHCWSISQGLATHLATPGWFQEGIASWVGEDLAGGSSYATNWWHFYMTPSDFSIITSEYPTIGFWAWIDENGGDLWAQIPELYAIAGSAGSGALYTAVTQAFDEATFSGLAGARMREAALGSPWTMDAMGSASRHRADPEPLVIGSPSGPDAPPGSISIGRYVMPPAAGDQVLGATLEGTGVWRARWSDGTEFTSASGPSTVNWCLTEPCVCPDGTAIMGWDPAPDSDGDILLTASAQRADRSAVTVTVIDLCPEDAPPPPEEEPTDAGALTGVWEATPAALNQMFANIFEASEVGSLAGDVSGTAVITFDGAGVAELRYINVAVPFDSAGLVTELGIDGGGELEYSISGSTITFTGTDLDLTFTLLGEEVDFGPDSIPLGAPSEVTWGLDGDRLTLQPESFDQAIPNQWDRNA